MAKLAGKMFGRLTRSAEHEHFRHDVMVEAEAEVAFDSRSELPRIEVPVLLLNGGDDHYFPMDLIAETAELIPDCRSKVYEGKSHVQAAAEKRLARDIAAFIARS